MFKKNLVLIVLISLAVLSSDLLAQRVSKTGTTAAKFLSIGVGPRAIAMGSAFSSVANDASAIYWNPAGIAFSDEFESIFTYTNLFLDLNLNFFGIIIPAGNLGNFAASVTALNYGTLDVTTETQPDGTGETFSPDSYSFALSYAKRITDDFTIGATAKLIREDIFNSSATGVGFDIGTIFNSPFFGLRFASSISNFGTKMSISGNDLLIRYDSDPNRAGNNETVDALLDTDNFDLPLRLQIGVSRDIIFMDNQRLTLSVDALVPNDNRQSVNIGGELSLFNNVINLRGGYKALFLTDSQEGLTLGVGLNYDGLNYLKLSVDYAYQQFDFLGDVHSFGIVLKF